MEINQKPFFEREGNQIRFRSTKTITWNQWNKIFNKLNHLNYGFPDIDSVKDYFDRGNWLNEDQSLAVLEVFGLHTRQPMYTKEQMKEDTEKAIEYFGTTKQWKQGGYLLTNGLMLDFSAGQGWERVIDHRDIKDVIDVEEDYNGYKAMVQFMNYGNIRMHSCGIDLTIPPNEQQRRVLGAYLRNIDSFYVDISNETGQTVQTFEYDFAYPGQILRDIDDYFKSLELDTELEEERELE